MSCGCKDRQAKDLNNKTFTICFIDSAYQIYIEENGLARIPSVDSFVPL